MARFRMTYIVFSVTLTGLLTCAVDGAPQSKGKDSSSKVYIGTFDSRAVAIAYYRSKTFNHQMMETRAEYEKAKKVGNDKRIKELEVEGSALQKLIHKQGFSTWPVTNILEKIKTKIPTIAKQANVDVIVSKWSIAYQQSEVKFIDVTEPMVLLFEPDKETLNITKEIQKQDPIPIEELGNNKD